MKKLSIGLMFVSGMFMGGVLAAQEEPAPPPQQQAHLNEWQREALRTQSPPVKTHSRKHADRPSKYVVTENKTTIVAVRPFQPNQ